MHKNAKKIKSKERPLVISRGSYKKIFSVGRKLLLQHGIHRISVDEICRESNISRMTFYKEFKNKKELALAIFEDAEMGHVKMLEKLMQEKTAYPKIIEFFLLMENNISKELGSVFIKDIMSDNETFEVIQKNMLINSQNNWRLKLFQRGREEGYVREVIDEVVFINFLEALTILFSRLIAIEKFSQEGDKLSSFIMEMFLYGVYDNKFKK